MKLLRVVGFSIPSLLIAPDSAAATSREVQYAPVPPWVLTPPTSPAEAKVGDAAFRIAYQDSEERITESKLESYSAYRVTILAPEALPMGNITILWSPSAGTATVHYVHIIRDGQSIDVLKQSRFKVLEREAGLEQSILDGNLTATLQIPGLQVGDEIEFAGTITRSEPAFDGHAAGAAQLPASGLPGVFRYRLLWPEGKPVRWRLTKDLPATSPTVIDGFKALSVEMRDPSVLPEVEGAPPRYNVRRAIEHSDYSDWPALSRQYWPLFAKASTLEPNSPLRTEAAKIAAAYSDPTDRVQAALRLVQEQIRYVYVGLDGGNYIPTDADDTWQRRFGDCKAKTAVLLALLKELGINADPILVNSKGGDGIPDRMPNQALFDHVLVRAKVKGNDFWLDGTRLGDHFLNMIPQPEFEWALPLTQGGSGLVEAPSGPLAQPQSITIQDIDASAGFAKDAAVTVTHIARGDEALQIKAALSTVSPADADQLLKAYWRQQDDDLTPDDVSWHYDDRHAALILTVRGARKVEWDGDDARGHSLTIPGAGFYPPAKMARPKDQDQTAAWAVEYPRFRCWATTVHLPPSSGKFHWTYRAKPVSRQLGGIVYWRAVGMQGGIIRTVMSRNSEVREITAAEAQSVNSAIPSFDNQMSIVEQTTSGTAPSTTALPFRDDTDWSANSSACSPPPPPPAR